MTEIPVSHLRYNRRMARLAVLGLTVLALAAGFAGGRATLAAPAEATAPAARTASAMARLPDSTDSYSPVVEKVAPAVVTVRVEAHADATPAAVPEPFRDFFGPGFRVEPRGGLERGLGSGVIIRAEGDILTNHHVIANAERIHVDLPDGRSFPAKVVGSDPASDLAVIRVQGHNLPTVAFGDSDSVKVGDVVLAFGNPLGVGQTVTMGIVSAKGRATGVGDGNYEDFLQTDAPINRGNSGGALVNTQGALVGINTQIVSPSGGNIGLGFAIPSAMAQAVADQLLRDGVVHRSMLGVTVQSLTSDLAESLGAGQARGALVSAVEPGSPGDQAGLKQGDVITAIDGRQVSDANVLRNQVASARPGTSVTLSVLRDGRTESLEARLVEREHAKNGLSEPAGADAQDDLRLGLAVTPVTPRVAEEMDLPARTSGLLVTDVDPDGTAASVGIQSGDLIKSVNGRPVQTVAALRTALAAHTGKPALVLVERQGEPVFVALPHERS